jgi:putative NADPH-quinone reductase
VKKTLCIYAHPNHGGSRANRWITQQLALLPNLTFRSLYEIYPEFYIDVEAEKKLLVEHDLLVFQHPFFWYSMPPLLKLWLDEVLEMGFAYGQGGHALRGKDFLLSITTGGPAESYSPSGYNSFPIESFFPAYEQTAKLCGMKWHQPVVLHHSKKVSEDVLAAHAEKVRDRILEISNPMIGKV